MTLVLTVTGRESIWLLADRRLSYGNRAPKDDARKVMILETTDGIAILGYAGLGATAVGTEPADWMSAVLRGQNLSLEQSLGVLADAMKRQFPKHLVKIPKNRIACHHFLISAFLGNESKLYTIKLVFAPDRKNYYFRYTSWHVEGSESVKPRPPRLGLAGTGGLFLDKQTHWRRRLFDLVRANEHRQISAQAVADHLARLNYQVHLDIEDKSVGPNCLVVWRYRKDIGIHRGGGAHQFYTGTTRDKNSPALPTIAGGMDVEAIAKTMMPFLQKRFENMRTEELPDQVYVDQMNEKLADLPDKPDEELR
jgi:hypothetical protein